MFVIEFSCLLSGMALKITLSNHFCFVRHLLILGDVNTSVEYIY